MLQVEMLSTGDEVLYGQIIDTNAAWLSDYFFQQGLPVTTRLTVGDNLTHLTETLVERSQRADILIVNGGLGPTSDDLTAQAAAAACQQPLVENAHWVLQMQQWFAKRDRTMAESNRKQAMLPINAELIDNPLGTACGFMIKLNRCLMFFTPGVPSEFKYMIEKQIMPMLRQHFAIAPPTLCLRLTTFGRSESQLAQSLDQLALPAGVVLGYRAFMPYIELKLTGSARLQTEMQLIWQRIRQQLSENILYEGTDGLPGVIARYIEKQPINLAVCEGASAGLVSLTLIQAGIGLQGSEILPNNPMCAERLMTRGQEAARRFNASYTLVTSKLADNCFSLALITDDRCILQHVTLSITSLSVAVLQEIITTMALDLLRRQLLNLPTAQHYDWLVVSEQIVS